MSFETVCIKTRQTIKLREVYSAGGAIASPSSTIRAVRRHFKKRDSDHNYRGFQLAATVVMVTVTLFASRFGRLCSPW